jgi:hypothetical protein
MYFVTPYFAWHDTCAQATHTTRHGVAHAVAAFCVP